MRRFNYFPITLLLLLHATWLSAASLQADQLWIREAPPNARVLAAYGQIINLSDHPITLLGVTSQHFASIEIHQTTTVDGISRMQHQEVIQIPAGKTLHLAPGGLHMMLIKPVHSLRAGDSVELVLITEGDEHLTVEATVRKSHQVHTNQHHHH